MTPQLDIWVRQASRKLSREARATVRVEIEAHYDAAREAALVEGASEEEAERAALQALGEAAEANRQYQQALLTRGERRVLREGNWEARAVCGRKWLKGVMLAIPLVVLGAAVVLLARGAGEVGAVLLAGALALAMVLGGPFLPVYTAGRARVYRAVKWVAVLGMLVIALPPTEAKTGYLFFTCLSVWLSVEWTRMKLRRKLPVARWPRQLYL